MSFLNKLLKGFIRSTVNQVGRDSGKVISNKIYKDRHSTPVKISTANKKETFNTQENNDGSERPIGFKHQFLSDSWYMYFFVLLGSIILFPISWIYYLGKGIIYLSKSTITLTGKEIEEVYKTDKRFKEGVRLDGHKEVTKIIEFPAAENELQLNKIKGFIYIGIVIILYGIPLIYYFK